MSDRDMDKSNGVSGPDMLRAQQLAAKFKAASQHERIADPKLKNAAKVVAIGDAHIDAAFKPGSTQNLNAKTMLIDVIAANIAKGRIYDKPQIDRVTPAIPQEIKRFADRAADVRRDR